MSDEKEIMQKLIEDSVVLIVKTSLKFKAKVEIRGVICITADQGDVSVVHIDQNLQTEDMIKKEIFQEVSTSLSCRDQQTPAKKIKLDNNNTDNDVQLSFTDDLDNQSFFQIQNYNSVRQKPSSSHPNNINNLNNLNSENINSNLNSQNNNVNNNLNSQNLNVNKPNPQNTNIAADIVFNNSIQFSEDTKVPVKTSSNVNIPMDNQNNQVVGPSFSKKPVDVKVLVKQLLQQQNQQKSQKQNILQQNLQMLPIQQSPHQQQPHQQQVLQNSQTPSKMFMESPLKNNQVRMLNSPMSMQSPSKPRGMLMQANQFRQQHLTPPNQKMQLQLVESHPANRGRGKSSMPRGKGRGRGEGWWNIEESGAGGDGYSFGKQTVVQYVCNICKGVYNSHSGLLNHQVRNHGRQKKIGVGRKPKNQSSSFNGVDQTYYEDDGYYQEDGYEAYE